MERVKNRLFTGGLDPGRLRDELAELASTRGSLAHNRELKRLEGRRLELQRRLAELEERRRAILEREREAAARMEELEPREEERRRLAAETAQLEERLAFLRLAGEKRELNDLLSRLRRGEERAGRLEELAGCTREELRAYDALEAEQREARRLLELSEQEGRARQAAVRRKEEAAAGQEQRAGRLDLAARAAAGLAGRVEAARREQARRPAASSGSPRWNRGFLLLFLAAVAVGVGTAVLFEDPVLRFGFSAAVILLAAVPLLLSRRPGPAGPGADPARGLRDEWRALAAGLLPEGGPPPGADGPGSAGLDGLLVELLAVRAQAGEAGRALLALREEAGRERGELRSLEAGLQAGRLRADALRARCEEWLRRRGAADRDAFMQRVTRREALREEQERWQEELRGELARRAAPAGPPSAAAAGAARLRQDVERRLDRAGPRGGAGRRPGGGAAPPGGAAAGGPRPAGGAERGGRRPPQRAGPGAGGDQRLAGHPPGGDRRRGAGAARGGRAQPRAAAGPRGGRAGRLPVRADRPRLRTLLRELGGELARRFGEIVRRPGERPGEVDVPALDPASFRVADGGGEKRPLEQLSRGTRDAFMLAARLTLARQAVQGEGLLLLDEPFQALDRRRVEQALRLVAGFQRETGWQVVLLSKDEGLAGLAGAVFSGLLVHQLWRRRDSGRRRSRFDSGRRHPLCWG